MTREERRRVRGVMLCHFVASLAALGMPPFFATLLSEEFGSSQLHLVGWLYVLPTVCSALAAPWWGRFADRFGARRSLIRAQIGLALGFGLASQAGSVGGFALALVVQGLLGGTFAASNTWLAGELEGERLARALTAMQASARAALVVAPILFGALMGAISPLTLYAWLALLPLTAAALVATFPAPGASRSGAGTADAATGKACPTSGDTGERVNPGLLLWLQFGFSFACVVTYPYFIADLQARFAGLSTVTLAALFSLPHLVYLACSAPLGKALAGYRPRHLLTLAFAAMALACWAQYALPGGGWQAQAGIWLARLAMGLAMTTAFVALHRLMSDASRQRAGRLFGRLDAAAKWAGVTAGLGAGLLASRYGLATPLLASAWVLAALGLSLVPGLTRLHSSLSPRKRT
ncbi:MFS transporter [Halomonas beimenensis]|uniref:Vibrioferrin membrane-spanning transport protein PvsC n=1 Tax=Halomonas beimenensis TaxID=475662 RepID=A0A291PA08_9GAMM|nr:MFS transporter [Halomonas beimenensis]ATJ83707.1 vibrioferrin membrane-spanning transport protein PvsC [Halomonas beimenensis]